MRGMLPFQNYRDKDWEVQQWQALAAEVDSAAKSGAAEEEGDTAYCERWLIFAPFIDSTICLVTANHKLHLWLCHLKLSKLIFSRKKITTLSSRMVFKYLPA
jgi:hypothetical protein